MSQPAVSQPPLDEPQPSPHPDQRLAAQQSTRDARRSDLAYGCVDWFEYSDAGPILPILEITRFAPQRVEKDRDEQPRAARKA